ncbi:MAG: hypothetical protein KDA55_18850, partial [Planctomycetales bacterium]|nr:hypothetical protein [Planctomycetales bacterium]
MSEAPIEHTASLSVEAELEAFVAAYEAALAHGAAELEHYLPPTEHPRHVEIAAELVRVDLEWRSSRNEVFSLDSYRSLAPAAFDDADARAAMAFEEYRLRRANGEAVERT